MAREVSSEMREVDGEMREVVTLSDGSEVTRDFLDRLGDMEGITVVRRPSSSPSGEPTG